MHIPKAATTLPVLSTVSYVVLISSANAKAAMPTPAPVEASRTAFLGPCLRPLSPALPRYGPLPEAKLLAWKYREGSTRANWFRQVEHLHGRGPMRVATADREKALI